MISQDNNHKNTGRYKKGRLIFAGNSIGLVDDIPKRTLEALHTSDLLIFEEDRGARKVLKAAGLHREYLKFTEHKEKETIDLVRKRLKKGDQICYVSDQGMPGLADPGAELLEIAYSTNSEIRTIPGPSSITAAVSVCPFINKRFRYIGFLERKRELRIKDIRNLTQEVDPFVILDTPYRLKALIQDLIDIMGEKRECLLALDITGPNETYICNKLKEIQKVANNLDQKLNFVLIVKGK